MTQVGIGTGQSRTRQCLPGKVSSAGFSLVELMVAMVIGLLGIAVMMQMFSMFEQQKRTTTGGDDAISSGAIALNGLQRDIQQSGWGITSPLVAGCTLTGLAVSPVPLASLTINPTISGSLISGDANSDTLMIVSGAGNGSVEGDLINSQTGSSYAVNPAESYTKGQAGPPAVAADQVFSAPALPDPRAPLSRVSPCGLTLTSVTNVVRPSVTVAAGVAGMTGGRLFNLGSAPRVRVYAVRNGNLMVCDYTVGNCAADTSAMTVAQVNAIWTTLANNVVSLRAQYGRDTAAASAMDAIVDKWDQRAPTTVCELLRISAVRLALVARSSQPEKNLDGGGHVTEAVPTWAGSDAEAVAIDNTAATAVAITLPSPDGTWPTWQDFRYKVFQTTIPLRNITSMGVVLGC